MEKNHLHMCSSPLQILSTVYSVFRKCSFIECRSPVVKLSPSRTLVGKPIATKVAYFSARGPSSIAPFVLKVFLTCIICSFGSSNDSYIG